jgi:hypothetical protein
MDVQQIMEMLIEMKADTKAMQGKADAGQAEIIAAIKVKTDAWIANRKIDRKETPACQYAMEASLKNMEPNLREKEKRDSSLPRRYGDEVRSRKVAVRGGTLRNP